MATIAKTPAFLLPSRLRPSSLENPKARVSFSSFKHQRPIQISLSRFPFKHQSFCFKKLIPFASSGETIETQQAEDEEETEIEEESDEIEVDNSMNNDDIASTEETTDSVIMATLQTYKQALANEDESTISEIESFLQLLEDEKISLADKVNTLTAEMATERVRVLRISADFDNFRKRTERERLTLMTNAQGEVVESLLPVLDNFDRAKTQIKVETEGEKKINDSYQSIYKQFLEVFNSLGVETVETIGTSFDPLLHEAIMREDSTEYDEGIITQEFRKGFQLGERLLRPSMVKVSAGPGPAKSVENDTVAPAAVNEEKEELDNDGAGD